MHNAVGFDMKLRYARADGEVREAPPDKQKRGKQQVLAVRNPPIVDHPEGDAPFGDYKLMQSSFKTKRNFVEVGDINKSLDGQRVWVRGRVHTVRGKGKAAFIVLRRKVYSLQLTLFAGERDTDCSRDMVKFASKIPSESVVDVEGFIKATDSEIATATQSDVELAVQRIFVVSATQKVLPFQMEDISAPRDRDELGNFVERKGQTAVDQSLRLDYRFVDVRTQANHAILRIQSAVGRYFRDYFLQKDFVEIHTPKITPGVSEGGSEVFRLKYFGRNACLAQSPQLYKQMGVISDLLNVFEIGPVFRAENSNTPRHMCEFVGMDFEMEIKEHYHEVLKTLGDLFVYIFDQLSAKHKDELAAINRQYPFKPLKYRRDTMVLEFKDTIKMLNDAGVKIGKYEDYSTPQEKKLGQLVKEKYDIDFYIVDKYPLTARPFYTMPDPEDPNYTNSYDVFVRGQEITSGAQRIHDVELLMKRARECEIPYSNIASYLESFRYGAYPHGGAGIGLERVVMLYLNLDNIRKSSFFPRTPTRLTP